MGIVYLYVYELIFDEICFRVFATLEICVAVQIEFWHSLQIQFRDTERMQVLFYLGRIFYSSFRMTFHRKIVYSSMTCNEF